MLNRTLHAALVALLLATPAMRASARDLGQDQSWCENSADTHASAGRQIAACTALIESGVPKGSQLAQVYVDRGLARIGQGNASAALEDFDTALTLEPGYAYALTARGAAYTALRRYGQAIADFNAYLKARPDDAGAYAAKASAEEALGKATAAAVDLAKACAMQRNYCN